jgi:hypothetical protein
LKKIKIKESPNNFTEKQNENTKKYLRNQYVQELEREKSKVIK